MPLGMWLWNILKSTIIFHATQIDLIYLFFWCPKFEDKNISENIRPKWSFIKSIPGQWLGSPRSEASEDSLYSPGKNADKVLTNTTICNLHLLHACNFLSIFWYLGASFWVKCFEGYLNNRHNLNYKFLHNFSSINFYKFLKRENKT
jgi:hypothetical protein